MAISKKKSIQNYPKKSQIKKTRVDNALERQMLMDLERRISLNVGNFLVLTEEGTPTQIALAHQKAKTEFLKFGSEMSKLANQVGGLLPDTVSEFLDSVDTVLYCGLLDEEKINQCFSTTQKLQSELKF